MLLNIIKTDLGMQVSVWGVVVGTFDSSGVDCYDEAYMELLKDLRKTCLAYGGLLN